MRSCARSHSPRPDGPPLPPPPSVQPGDTDGDGLPNEWEVGWGLDERSPEGENGATGDPDGDGVVNIEEHRRGTHPRGFVTRYFAEGALNDFFDTRFALANMDARPARVLLEFQDLEGNVSTKAVTLPGRSRVTVFGDTLPILQGQSFATRLATDPEVLRDPAALACERACRR
jgi:hypothetical protein